MSTDVSEEHIASIFRVEKISQARKHRESRFLGFFFDPEVGGGLFLRNVS
jgi:hypothetical protein